MMEDFVTQGFVLRIVYSIMMVVIVWLLLRGLDKLSGVNFKEIMGVIREDAIAAALYLGLRFIGVVVGIGLVVS
jgi:hypothetical protein